MAITLQHPLPGARPTDPYGWRDAIPGVRPAELHNGQDYAADAGTMIRAAHTGRVSYVGWDSLGGGWMVMLDADDYQTLYLHMRERSPLVEVGQQVAAGQGIGYVGASGAATGPHLHFMLRNGGKGIDPVPYIAAAPEPAPNTTTNIGDEMPWILILMKKHYYLIQPKATGKAEAILLGAESLDPKQGASVAMLPRIAAHTADFTQNDIKRTINGIRASHLPLAK